jgi:hypothetical protein
VIAGAALKPRYVVGRLAGSATVQMSLIYATAGVVYTLANLMLARILSIPEYASVTLILAIIGFGGIVAPMGQDRAVVRHHLPATPSLLAHGLASATTIAFGGDRQLLALRAGLRHLRHPGTRHRRPEHGDPGLLTPAERAPILHRHPDLPGF